MIHTLCIPPDKAGHGYGSEMVRFIIDFASRTDCKCIRIDTRAHNEPAQHLYEKFGFKTVGFGRIRLHGLIDEEQVYMERCLPGSKGE